MARGFWQPQTGPQLPSDLPQQQQQQEQACPSGPQRQRVFAVITRPLGLVGRAASGVSTVMQRPVRAARGRRRDGAVAEAPAASEPLQAEPQRQRMPWDGLVENVRGGIAGARELLPRGGEATPQALLKRCFPPQLSHAGGAGTAAFTGTTHDLAASGTRLFGLSMGRAKLQVKIYEFALYFDAKQARTSQLSKRHGFVSAPLQLRQQQEQEPSPQAAAAPQPPPQQQAAFADSLRSSPDIDMSLVVRASRALPLKLMTMEYERILKRRLQRVGGSPNDPALTELLDSFREERLPTSMLRNGNVQKDSVLTFTRAAGGRVTAAADGQELATVHSPAFAAAVFDLYVGDSPVSAEARTLALDAAARMMGSSSGSGGHSNGSGPYQPAPGLPGVCEGAACTVGSGSSGGGPQWPWDHVFRPQLAV